MSRLDVVSCNGHPQPVTAIHPQYLPALDVDSLFFDEVDWLPQTGLIELSFFFGKPFHVSQRSYVEQVHTLLTQAPQSLGTLALLADVRTAIARGVVRSMLLIPHGSIYLSFIRSHSMCVVGRVRLLPMFKLTPVRRSLRKP